MTKDECYKIVNFFPAPKLKECCQNQKILFVRSALPTAAKGDIRLK